MFQGSYAINMDAKGRIAIPAKCRDLLAAACEGKIVITAHNQDRCLLVYPEGEWDTNILPKIQSLPSFNKAALRIQRLLIGYASSLELDGNGRVLLPPTLREYAGLEKKLMLVGIGNKFELWNEESWWASIDESADGDLPEEMLSLSL